MPNLLTLRSLAEGFSSALIGQQVAGVLDLMGLAVGIWTIWSSITLPLDGKLQRAFQLIGFGALAFAMSHLIDSLVGDLRLLSGEQTLLLTQGTVLISMLFFIPGLAGLADVLPMLSSARRLARIPHFWPLAIVLAGMIVAFSFVLFGISPEAEAAAFIALDGVILLIAGLCVLLLLRTHIGGVIGRCLWLAMVGLVLFSLAHPLQVWLVNASGLPDTTLAIIHRLIVMPSLMLFALSLTSLARRLSASLYGLPARPAPPSTAEEAQKQERWKAMNGISPRARAHRHSERKPDRGSLKLTRPFPALRLRSSKRP